MRRFWRPNCELSIIFSHSQSESNLPCLSFSELLSRECWCEFRVNRFPRFSRCECKCTHSAPSHNVTDAGTVFYKSTWILSDRKVLSTSWWMKFALIFSMIVPAYNSNYTDECIILCTVYVLCTVRGAVGLGCGLIDLLIFDYVETLTYIYSSLQSHTQR